MTKEGAKVSCKSQSATEILERFFLSIKSNPKNEHLDVALDADHKSIIVRTENIRVPYNSVEWEEIVLPALTTERYGHAKAETYSLGIDYTLWTNDNRRFVNFSKEIQCAAVYDTRATLNQPTLEDYKKRVLNVIEMLKPIYERASELSNEYRSEKEKEFISLLKLEEFTNAEK